MANAEVMVASTRMIHDLPAPSSHRHKCLSSPDRPKGVLRNTSLDCPAPRLRSTRSSIHSNGEAPCGEAWRQHQWNGKTAPLLFVNTRQNKINQQPVDRP